MTKVEYNARLGHFLDQIIRTAEQGQGEYTLNEDAFDNFNRLAEQLELDRKQVLWVYLSKHLDGIKNAIRGHIMQREPVRDRIKDAIVYLTLLEAMFYEEHQPCQAENISLNNSNIVAGAYDPAYQHPHPSSLSEKSQGLPSLRLPSERGFR